MEEKVLALLEEICEDDVVRTDRDINLFEEDLVDSLAFTELLVGLEEKFGIVIAPSEVEKQDVDTPNKVIQLVLARA
ncbi:MAG: D-alanine--poly(phosphoribitol) ligase subunit DltC [Firmicutes bacterium]|jgi:D-alanine--poly(phosphoribitol) ligase subunit 2|nr:D-alanine--poly(phosphoribitol) ligase subunit DltC [Bacillota bacterium]